MFVRSWLIAIICAGLFGAAYPEQTVQLSNSTTDVRLLEQDRAGLTMEIEIGSINFNRISTREGPFVLMTVDGFTHSHRIGEPNLPMVNRILSIPYGCELQAEVTDYEIEEISLTDLNLYDPLIPVQPSLSKSQDPEDVPFEYNRTVYQQRGYYSLSLTEISAIGTLRALPLGMIEISPIEYNPEENTLRVYKHLTIEVNFLQPDWQTTEQMQRRFYSPFFEPVYHQIFNYEEPSPEILVDLVKYPIKYVIIADEMFTTQLQPFIEWKTKKGFTVVTGYTNVIGYDAVSIHNFIEDLYNNGTPEDPAPSFVLLVGDTPQIPTYDGYTDDHVTDLHYCEFDGNGDYFPEIYYGRFSAQNTSQLQPQIEKTLEYEQYMMPDPSYLAEVTLIAGVDASHAPTYGNGQINYGTNLYFNTEHGIIDHTWLYPASAEQGAAAAIIQTVNNGVGFINYTAHCGHIGFGDPLFTTSDIANLTNAHMYLLGIGNCCSSNTFDESTPCFGEAWLQAVDKGGVGYIGASNGTYWDEDYWWAVGSDPVIGDGPSYEETSQGAYDGVFHDHGEPVSEHYVVNDAIIFAGNLAVTESSNGLSNYYWEVYHLMGDPSVMNYMGEPSANTVSHLGTAFPASTSYTVNADPASYVGITFNDILHGAAYIGESGTVDVPITAFGVPGTADIVVTAQNRIPYASTIDVITPEGPYIVMDSYNINDNSGNCNGLVDAGESIVLGVQLMNIGPDDANSVEATLSTTDPDITITTASESYGTIPANDGFVNRPDAFAFDVAGSIPDGQDIPFELTVTSADRETWNIDISITAHSPILGYLSFIVDDAAGDGDGILEPGETGNLIVMLENTGSGLASSIVGTLTESDSYVSISDPSGDYGNILPDGGTADNSADVFVITADASCPTGYQMSLNLAVSGGGYSTDFDFDFYIGSNLSINPNSFSVITQPDNIEIRTLTISNDGNDPLFFSLSTETYTSLGLDASQNSSSLTRRPEPLGYHKADSGKPGAIDEPYFPPIVTGQGGPDGFGYRWIDSNEPNGPIYEWTDISEVGTPVSLSDDDYEFVSIDFSFPFYENSYSTLYICSNGMLTFDSGSTNWINDPIPSTGTPDNFIAPWWDDLNPYYGGSIYYYHDSANSRFIVSYEGLPYCSGGGSSTFQVILYTSGKITFQYNTMIYGSHPLNSATIGIENADGTDDLEICYNAPYMEDNLAIDIYSGWLSASPASGTINPHGSFDAMITFDASMLSEGAYTGNINLASNDITRPSIDIPASLEVTISGFPVIGLNVTEISETVDAGSVKEFELEISNYGSQDLTYSVSDNRAWINESPDNGTVSLGETDIVFITFDASSLTPGTYTGTVTVESNDPENSSIDLPVSLLVTDPAQEIPTLSEWGMIVMALLLLAAGTIAVIRRRQVISQKAGD